MIRTIHPFYIIGFMAVLLFNLIWENAKIKDQIAEQYSERATATMTARHIVELKKVMRTVEKSQIDNFLNGPQFSEAELTHQIKNGRYVVDAQSINGRQIQAFLNYVFNLSVKVVQLKIERKDDKHASLYMEISL